MVAKVHCYHQAGKEHAHSYLAQSSVFVSILLLNAFMHFQRQTIIVHLDNSIIEKE